MKNGKRAVAATLAILTLLALGQSAHAQTISPQYDRVNYVPGDSGTLTVVIMNTNANAGLEIRNITVYFPWAMFRDGKWDGANVSINLAQWKTLGSVGSGNNIYSTSIGFTIPSWYQASPAYPGGFCDTDQRYGAYTGCILVGITASPPRYEQRSLPIQMAVATFTPTSLAAEWLPIASLVVLIVATAFLGLAWISLRRAAKKA